MMVHSVYTAGPRFYMNLSKLTTCHSPLFFQNMIDGAAFLGVGFDGRGEYSPESRKMSIVQRNCKNKATLVS